MRGGGTSDRAYRPPEDFAGRTDATGEHHLRADFLSVDPTEVTSQMNTVDTLMDKQTMLLVRLKRTRARMVAQEVSVEEARSAVAGQRKQARRNLVRKQGLERTAAQARGEVATLVARGRAVSAQAAAALVGAPAVPVVTAPSVTAAAPARAGGVGRPTGRRR